MIWIVLLVLTSLVLAFICMPFFGSQSAHSAPDASLRQYGERINELENLIAAGGDDIAELTEAKIAMQRKALAEDTLAATSANSAKAFLIPVVAVFCVLTVFLYSQLGTPRYAAQQNSTVEKLEGLSLDQLVVRLEGNLKADPSNPNGWIYYARSLMTLGRHDEALAAYDQALILTNSDEKIVSERASAIRYLDQVQDNTKRRGPTSADVEAAAEMAPDEQAAMIQGMVDGLSEKLIANPLDEEGWVRLIKARDVLGQTEELATEIERMKSTFADQPETIEQILNATGRAVP